MKFKTLKKPVYTSDTYYDLFEGGYIKPEKLLADPADVARVQEAMKTIQDFLNGARDAGVLEEG